ncbi:hypothetical protein U1Q18_008970, partial [Sarracenia purpurea var. burkii]
MLLAPAISISSRLDDGKGLAQTVADVKDANKRGAFHFAAREGKTEVCKFLVEDLKLNVDTKDEDVGAVCCSFVLLLPIFVMVAAALFCLFFADLGLPVLLICNMWLCILAHLATILSRKAAAAAVLSYVCCGSGLFHSGRQLLVPSSTSCRGLEGLFSAPAASVLYSLVLKMFAELVQYAA